MVPVCLILVNLLSFHLLSSRKTIGMGSGNIYCLLITINSFFIERIILMVIKGLKVLVTNTMPLFS